MNRMSGRNSSTSSADFFGWRRYYQERHGHMNLREIHAHVDIRRQDAEDWLAVMALAMTKTGMPEREEVEIMATLRRAALMLVNRGEALPDPG